MNSSPKRAPMSPSSSKGTANSGKKPRKSGSSKSGSTPKPKAGSTTKACGKSGPRSSGQAKKGEKPKKCGHRKSYDMAVKKGGISPNNGPPLKLTAVRVAKVVCELGNVRGCTFESIRNKLRRTGYNADAAVVRTALARAMEAGLLRETRKEKRFMLPHTHNTRLASSKSPGSSKVARWLGGREGAALSPSSSRGSGKRGKEHQRHAEQPRGVPAPEEQGAPSDDDSDEVIQPGQEVDYDYDQYEDEADIEEAVTQRVDTDEESADSTDTEGGGAGDEGAIFNQSIWR